DRLRPCRAREAVRRDPSAQGDEAEDATSKDATGFDSRPSTRHNSRGREVTDRGESILEVEDLEVKFFTRRGVVQAVRDVTFTMNRGEVLGLVGESGSGKSVTSQAIMGLTELPGRITGGDVRWKGTSLLRGRKAADEMRRVRGNEIAMVFQDPMT